MNLFKRVWTFLTGMMPVWILLVTSFVATAFVLLLGWLLNLVAPITLWQAVIISTATLIFLTYSFYANFPSTADRLGLIILIPATTVVFLLLILPFVWLIPLVSPLDPWQATLVGTSMIFFFGYFSIEWLVSDLKKELRAAQGIRLVDQDDLYTYDKDDEDDEDDEDDDDDWEQFIDELDEGQYVIIRDRQTGLNLLLAADSIDLDEPCPCESGRKYRNCHGQGRTQSQARRRRR